MERVSVQRRGDRRRLWDRRSPVLRRAGEERRRLERRHTAHEVLSERRSGQDRRQAGRRRAAERRTASRRLGRRRRATPTPYSVKEIEELRARFLAPGPVTCPSCGSAFTLGPARRRTAETARRVVCLGCGRAAVVSNTRVARILVISQNNALRSGFQEMVASAGHEVIEAADAGVGLVAFEQVPADVVFVDVTSSGRMEAPDFLRRLRRHYPDVRVVALAGRRSSTGADPLAVMGGLGVIRALRAPISREQVLKTLEEVRP